MARREFARIGTDMPDEQSIRALTVGAQWLYDRLLLSKELSRCGVLPLRIALWSERAPDASEKKVRAWLKELAEGRHVVADERYQEVFVRTYVRHDGLLAQPNVVASMVSDFGLVASPTIRSAFLAELRRIWEITDLPEVQRGGWLLAVGHYPEASRGKDDVRTWPAVLPAASLSRLRKSIGSGLHAAVAEALDRIDLPAFDEASPVGVPEPFTRTLPGTPSRGRDRGERRTPSPTTYSGSERRAPDGPQSGAEVAAVPAGQHSATADDLLDRTAPWVGKVRTDLHTEIVGLLASGADPAAIERALAVWRTRKAGVRLLAHLVQDQLSPDDDAATDPEIAAWLERAEAAQSGAGR